MKNEFSDPGASNMGATNTHFAFPAKEEFWAPTAPPCPVCIDGDGALELDIEVPGSNRCKCARGRELASRDAMQAYEAALRADFEKRERGEPLPELAREAIEDDPKRAVLRATGTRDFEVGLRLIDQLGQGLVRTRTSPDTPDRLADVALGTLKELAPRDLFETLLSVQLVYLHEHSLVCLAGKDWLGADSLMRRFNLQLGMLAKYKAGGAA